MRTLLERTKNSLKAAGIDNPAGQAQDLICAIWGISPVEIITKSFVPDKDKESRLFSSIELIIKGKPIQYVIGKASFLDLELCVDERVLIPRPETELLAEMGRDFIEQRKRTDALDLCTGSACIAIYLSKHGAKVTATDISNDALDLAKENAAKCNQEIEFLQGDLFEALDKRRKFDLITANPPYIPRNVIPSLDLRVKDWEPMIALDGGENGFELPDRIVKAYDQYLRPGGLFLMEIGHDQGEHYKNLCLNASIMQDLEGHDRILAVRKI